MEADADGAGLHPAADEMRSPGLAAADGLGAAFELKFQLDPEQAGLVEAWARRHLTPDRHGDDGRYRVTSIYCDTPALDVFHRSGGFRRTKFRIRRYDDAARVFLERKRKRGDRVRKRRTPVDADELSVLAAATPPPADWAGVWFADRLRRRNLWPTACVTYRRAAYFGLAAGTPVRLTMDRDLVGVPAAGWHVPQVEAGQPLLPGAVLMELKFHVHMPVMFQDLLALLPGQLARASKYRRCVELCGIWDGTPPATPAPTDSAAAPADATADITPAPTPETT